MVKLLGCFVFCGVASSGCGGAPNSEDATADGTEQGIQEGKIDPGHPAVGLLEPESRRGDAYCTGTLVAPDWVLTSASCVRKGEDSDRIVRFYTGSASQEAVHRYDTAGMTAHELLSTASLTHPKFDAKAGAYNFALLRLASPITDIEPLAIGPKVELQNGMRCSVIGFGPRFSGVWYYGQKRVGAETIHAVDPVRMLATAGYEGLFSSSTDQGAPTEIGGDEGAPFLCGERLAAVWTRANDWWSVSVRTLVGAEPSYSMIDDATTGWIQSAIAP